MDKGKSAFSIPKKEFVLSEETATKAVVELLTFYDYDIDALEPAERKSTEKALKEIVGFYRQGRFENGKSDDGAPTVIQHLQETPGTLKSITYGEFTGEVRVQSGDGLEIKKETFTFIYRTLGLLSGIGEDALKKLRGGDLKAMEALGNLFFLLMS